MVKKYYDRQRRRRYFGVIFTQRRRTSLYQKLLSQAKKFPSKPGVYRFMDKKGQILYVGRTVNLKRRVLNYFPASLQTATKRRGSLNLIERHKYLDPRLQEMAAAAKKIKFQKTDTLLEAVILEANLIKKHWPKYNVKEKDDRSFIYIAFNQKEDFPRPVIARGKEIKNLKFKIKNYYTFGPYQSLTVVQNALKIIRRIFPYSTCVNSKLIRRYSGHSAAEDEARQRRDAFVISDRVSQRRPCFNYQIGLCPGVCVGAISKNDYQKNIKNIILLLSGQKKKLLKKLQKENPEKAQALKHIQDVALITKNDSGAGESIFRIEGYDVSHLTGKETYGSMAVFINGKANKEEYRLFKIKEAPANDDLRALEEMIRRRFHHPEWRLPDIILIDGGRPQVNFIHKILKARKINIPLVGVSKFAGDKLVFSPKTKQSFKDLSESIKDVLLKTRDEAHRFAIQAGRRRRRLKVL